VRILGFDDGFRVAPEKKGKREKAMAKDPKRPTVTITDCDLSHNRRHGLNVDKNAGMDVSVSGTRASHNQGDGFHIGGDADGEAPEEEPERPWFERPVGIVTLLVIAGLIVAYSAYRFGWV
jgi:hypothetical protein